MPRLSISKLSLSLDQVDITPVPVHDAKYEILKVALVQASSNFLRRQVVFHHVAHSLWRCMRELPISTVLRHWHCARRQKFSATLTEEQRGRAYQITEAWCAPVQVTMVELHNCPAPFDPRVHGFAPLVAATNRALRRKVLIYSSSSRSDYGCPSLLFNSPHP
jgi:hypothetical protein